MPVTVEKKAREFPFSEKNFNFLRKISNSHTGIVVSDDKMDMFYSRLSRRVRALGFSSFDQYCELIKNDSAEQELPEFLNSITTNLTAFFRENHHFDFLKSTAIPEIMQRNAQSRSLRIWSAGCSSGEEPYSLAMTLGETLPRAGGWDAQILATDIDSNVLAKAARGVYPLDRLKGIPKPRLRRWFMRGKGGQEGYARVKPEAQQLVTFGQLNLMKDWRHDELQDVIFCRNVIIYFDKPSKAKLVDRYADALVDGGYLFIGHSESLFKVSERFESLGHTIYKKKV